MNKPKIVAAARPSLPVVPLTVLMLITMMVLGGCNTMRGAGQDMQAAGSTIEKESNDARR